MEKKFYWGIAAVAILVLGIAFFKGDQAAETSDLPWHIEHPAADTSRIFGVTLGQTNTQQAEQHFKEVAKPILFKSPSGQLVVEVFFEDVTLAGLRARIVLTLAVPDAELPGMLDRGLRMNATGDGKKEITLTADDAATVFTMPITSLTYMPLTRLDDEIFAKRFGEPNMRVKEKTSGAIHWLYPQQGLDIALGGREKPLLQYVAPKDFNQLTQPLLANGELLK